MTALQALAHSRSRSVGMSAKKRQHAGNDRGSGFPRAAHPAHVVGPSYRHVFDGHGNREYDREVNNRCSAQGLKAFRKSVRDLLKMRLDKLKRQFAATHDIKVKKEIERLAKEYDKLKEPWRFVSK